MSLLELLEYFLISEANDFTQAGLALLPQSSFASHDEV